MRKRSIASPISCIVHVPAAEKGGEVERDGLDPLVLGRLVDRPDHVASGELPVGERAAQQAFERGTLLDFLDHRSAEVEQQRAVAHRRGARAIAQHREQGPEEQQQENQAEPVLDGDEQMPDLARETHGNASKFLFGVS